MFVEVENFIETVWGQVALIPILERHVRFVQSHHSQGSDKLILWLDNRYVHRFHPKLVPSSLEFDKHTFFPILANMVQVKLVYV